MYGVQNVKELCAKFELGLFAPERCDFTNLKIEVCPALAPDIERITLADIEPYVPRETRTIAVIVALPGPVA